jgi:hypothetical protein
MNKLNGTGAIVIVGSVLFVAFLCFVSFQAGRHLTLRPSAEYRR